jgi:AmmeMemoRadiSam system protein A
VARASIRDWLDGREAPPDVARAPEELLQPRGVFVSLKRHRDAELRGCVGRADAREPLLAAVARAAVAAATSDPRFAPVTAAELPTLAVQISVLGPLVVVRPEQVQVGVHGLMITHLGRQGLLLPQVAVREGWDRERLLVWTCRKAGLPPESWREAACRIEAFTAQWFEDEAGGSPESRA